MAHLPNSWTFAPQAGSSAARTVQFTPRLVVNSTYAAVASAVAGRGVARMYSYQVAEQVARGELEIVLAGDEDPEMPAHLICPQGRLAVPKVRAFTDFAVPRLKKQFCQLLKKRIGCALSIASAATSNADVVADEALQGRAGGAGGLEGVGHLAGRVSKLALAKAARTRARPCWPAGWPFARR